LHTGFVDKINVVWFYVPSIYITRQVASYGLNLQIDALEFEAASPTAARPKAKNPPLAVRAYKQCRRNLAEDLGIEPMAKISRLYQRITAGESL